MLNIDQIMCTDRCPCWSGHQIKNMKESQRLDLSNPNAIKYTYPILTKWTGYKGMDETYLNLFNRTKFDNPWVYDKKG